MITHSNFTLLINTNRLLLREFSLGDLEAISRIAKDPRFHFYNLDPKNPKTFDDFLDRAMNLACQVPRNGFKLAVCEKYNHNFIGYVAFDDLHAPSSGTPDIGYWIDPNFQSRGYAHEAMQGLMLYVLKKNPHISQVWATVDPENIASIKVLNKLGFSALAQRKTITTYRGEEERMIFLYRHDTNNGRT